MTLLPKKIHIDALHNDEEGFATAATEFVKAYTCLQIAIASCETFYDVFKHHHLDMGEVKKSYNTLMADMDHLANYLNTHFGFDTKALLGKVYDEAQADIDHELYGNENDDENEKNS